MHRRGWRGARQRAAGQVKVLGFGVAGLTTSWQNDPSTHVDPAGSYVAWLAPEQVDSPSHLTPAADVWALGLLAFMTLTGRQYWKGATPLELMKEAYMDPLAAASERADELETNGRWPSRFDEWFSLCMSRDPRSRFFHAAEATDVLVETHRANSRVPTPGNLYDDGMEGTFEEWEPQGDIGRGEGAYRKGVRPPERRLLGGERRELPMGNPKGSVYDRGLVERPRWSPAWIAAGLVLVGLAIAALWLSRMLGR